jgi:hypothetical protein
MRAMLVSLMILLAGTVQAQTPEEYRQDARSVEDTINAEYAYLDRFDGGTAPISELLHAQAEAVTDQRSLLAYAERALAALSDHHAITGASFSDSWAVVPSYADLWIEEQDATFVITAVRDGSPAQAQGVRPGDRLLAVDGAPVGDAVAAFWSDLGLATNVERRAFGARVLAAGRRDRARDLTIQSADGPPRRLTLPSLYDAPRTDDPLTVSRDGEAVVIRFNDSLGGPDTVAAFDSAMAELSPGQQVTLDLTDTPSGGNTVVARAIMGWFVDEPRAYQVHNLPSEQRRTGVPRQWIEQVLPRPGLHHDGSVIVRVGRWTGSMGEGLAIGFDALGAQIEGGPMAGLLGAVYDHRLQHSGLVLKLPTERLSHVDGRPREQFVPD